MTTYAFPSTRVHLDFDWEGETPISVNYRLLRLEAYLAHTEVLAEEAKEILQEDMHQKFETETAPDGSPWQELVKPEPQQIGILRRGSTGAAMFTATVDEGSWEASPVGVFFDTGELPPYWVYHEQPDGGTYKLVRREFVAPSDQAQEEIEIIAEAWMAVAIARATRGGRRYDPGSGRFRDPSTGRFMKAQ